MIRRQLCRSLQRFLAYQPAAFVKIPAYPAYSFSTAPTKKILDVWDLHKGIYMELIDALTEAHSCRMIAELLKENVHQMTDYQLSWTIYRIWDRDIELDDNFNNIILPIVKEFVKNFDRENNKALYELVTYLAYLKVEDEGLWSLFEQKLLGEKLYRYIPNRELCEMIYALGEANKGSQELWNIFERVLVKHRLNLLDQDIDFAKTGFESRKAGSQLLFQVFENPTKPLPADLEPERIRIEKKH